MTHFEKNINSIENTHAFFYSKLKDKLELYNYEVNNVKVLETMNGEKTIGYVKDSYCYRLSSLYEPIKEANRWVQQFDFRNIGKVVIMFGLANGIYARELLNKLHKEDICVIYEPSFDIFVQSITHFDMSDIFERENLSIIIKDMNDIEFTNILNRYVNWINLNTQILSVHPQYNIVFETTYIEFLQLIRECNSSAVVRKNTDVSLGKASIDNMFENFKLIDRYVLINDLYGKFHEEVPAIIVAAGPSLDKNIEMLKEVKGRAIIFAVDTAVKYLLQHDILPDFIVTIDPNKPYHHLEDKRCKDIPLVCASDSLPEYLKGHNSKLILLNFREYMIQLFEKVNIKMDSLAIGGSVATATFAMCKALDFKNIILIGQDLAYSGEFTHAGNVHFGIGANQTIALVEDIYGNPIKTRKDWQIFIQWFEEAIENLEEGKTVIDATEGGAKIQGTVILTLKEAIDKYCIRNFDCTELISTLVPSFNEEDRLIIKQSLICDIHELSEIREAVIAAINISEKLIIKYEKSEEETTSSKLKNEKLTRLNADIEKKGVYSLIDVDISASTLENLSDIYIYTKDKKKDKIVTYEKALLLYKAILKSIDRIQPKFDDIIKNI